MINNCKVSVYQKKKKGCSIHIEGLSRDVCIKIQDAIDNGCVISFFGDYDYFLDVSIDKKDE